MKIVYITNTRIPTKKANAIQVLKCSDAWIDEVGRDNFLLLLPNRPETDPELWNADIGKTYLLKNRVVFRKIPVIDFHDWLPWQTISFVIETMSFGVSSLLCVWLMRADILYTREFYLVPFLLLAGKPLFFEAHYFPQHFIGKALHRLLVSRLAGVVTITSSMRDLYQKSGFSPRRIMVARDGVDLRDYSHQDSSEIEEKRKEFAKPKELIIGYLGRMTGRGENKGVDVLIKAFSLVREQAPNTKLLLVGGSAREIEVLQKQFTDLSDGIVFTGEMPYSEMPPMNMLIDVAVIPLPDHPYFRYAVSPLKLFDYLAAGKPIVASDLPSLREVLGEENAVFVKPGDEAALEKGIAYLVNNADKRREMGKKNRILAREYTWQKRVKTILQWIG